MTANRETDWADAFPRHIESTTGDAIDFVYDGYQPVAEVDYDLTAAEGAAGLRYGGIGVPIFFADFEVGNLSFWSTSVGGPP